MFWNKDKIPNLKLEDEDFFSMDEDIEEKEKKEINQLMETEEIEKKEKFNFRKLDIDNEDHIRKINKILNIFIIIILIASVLIITDVILVSRTGTGPYFALNTKTYDDGGTKIYHGLGYKVIKYNQQKGRKDTIIGSWSIKYNTTPIKTTILDLALEFNNDLEKTIDTYMNNYIQISGKIEKISKNEVVLAYKDEEKKYTTKLSCNLLNSSNKYKKNDSLKLVGTLYNYSKEDELKLYMKNCYIKK